jgi:hypothetical protein
MTNELERILMEAVLRYHDNIGVYDQENHEGPIRIAVSLIGFEHTTSQI